MAMLITEEETMEQSLNAFRQWADLWKKHAEVNKNYIKGSLKELHGVGVDRTIVLVGFGNSLYKNIKAVKALAIDPTVDIFCCDKALKYLVENGVTPQYCMVEDAQVSWEKYGKDVDTSNITLIANICINPVWVENWKGSVFFHINKDNLGSEKIFQKITGLNDLTYAASNVANTMMVIASQFHFNYSHILLVGYDYSWDIQDNYYCGEDNEKKYHLNHIRCLDLNNDIVSTSNNLYFAARWLQSFVEKFKMPVINLSGQGILYKINTAILVKQEVN